MGPFAVAFAPPCPSLRLRTHLNSLYPEPPQSHAGDTCGWMNIEKKMRPLSKFPKASVGDQLAPRPP